MPKPKFLVHCFFDDNSNLDPLPQFNKWFTNHQIVPKKGEELFPPENRKDFKEESKHSGSCCWFVSKVFYEPHENIINVWFKDSENLKK